MSSDPRRRLGRARAGRRAGAARRGVRARHGGVAAGPSSGQQGSRAIVTAGGRDHGWIGGACAEPVVIREAQRAIARRRAAAAAARHARAVRRSVPDGMTRHPDLVPERGRDGGVHRTGRPDPAPGRRRPLADGAHAVPTWPVRSAGGPTVVDGADFSPPTLDARVGRGGRDPGPRRRGGGRAGGVGRRPRSSGWSPPASAARRCSATSPTGACRGTCSTGCGCRSGSTSATPRTARSRWRSWPSWSSCGPPARSAPEPRSDAAVAPRDRGDRPGVRHDGHGRRRQPSARARRRHLLLLLRRLPRRVREGPARLPRPRRPDADQERLRGRPARRQGLAVLRRHPAGGRLPARRGADRRPRRRQVQGQGRDPDGAGQAAVRRHRRRSRSATTRPSASSSTPPAPTRRAAARPPCWSPRSWRRPPAAPRSRSTRTCSCPARPRSTAAA